MTDLPELDPSQGMATEIASINQAALCQAVALTVVELLDDERRLSAALQNGRPTPEMAQSLLGVRDSLDAIEELLQKAIALHRQAFDTNPELTPCRVSEMLNSPCG